MLRFSLRCLLALLLLFAQYGAQMHAMSHLRHDLEVAQLGEKHAPPLGHSIEQCVAFYGVSSVLSSAIPPVMSQCVSLPAVSMAAAAALLPARFAFDPRAPPAFS